jgi:hypothetical protein
MGQEVECVARHAGQESSGRAQLETDDLRFRGDFRVSVLYRDVTAATAVDGTLTVEYPDGPLELDLGARAEKWGHSILHPRTVIEKLGVKPGQRVALRGIEDPAFRSLLAERGADIADDGEDIDHLFTAAETPDDLDELAGLRTRLAPSGGLWTIRRKGSADVGEHDVRHAGRAAGLVDVKVVRFSDTHTAEKFVIPKAERE